MEGDRMMLVYEHKTNDGKLVPSGVALMDEMELLMAMSKDSSVYLVTKALKPGQTHIDLYKSDLVRDGDPKIDRTDGETPWRAWLGYEWEGHSFTELTILTIAPQHALSQSDSAKDLTAVSEGDKKDTQSDSAETLTPVSVDKKGGEPVTDVAKA